MIRRALCEYYIKALMLEGPEKDLVEHQAYLDGMMLDYPGLVYLSGIRDQLEPPDNFNPRVRTRETRNFLISEGLLEYFENGPDARKAKEILSSPRSREFTEALLLGSAPSLAIARRLVDMYKMRSVTAKAVDLYRHFYFNLDLLDSTETRALLPLKIERMCKSEDTEEAIQGRALKNAFYSDPRRAAANMPRSAISAIITQLQMGLMPDGVDLKKIAQLSETMAHLRLFETISTAGRDYEMKAANLSTTIRILKELRESTLNPEDELKKQLETLSIRTAQSGLPSVSDVTGGQHTVDLMALPVSKDPDEQPDK